MAKSRSKELDWYVLEIWGLVEPNLIGPSNYDEANNVLEEKREADGDGSSYHLVSVTKGAEIDI